MKDWQNERSVHPILNPKEKNTFDVLTLLAQVDGANSSEESCFSKHKKTIDLCYCSFLHLHLHPYAFLGGP